MADDNIINNPIAWAIGGLLALLGIAGLAGMNKPAGGPTTTGTTMTDSAPKPKSGCGCSAHS